MLGHKSPTRPTELTSRI